MEKTKILIVEDEGIVALNMKLSLIQMGFEITGIAVSGQNALKIVEENSPHLVLMDIRLKGDMDGIETAAIIKKEYAIPVIYITAFDDESIKSRAMKTLPSAFLVKPLTTEVMKEAIDNALKNPEDMRPSSFTH